MNLSIFNDFCTWWPLWWILPFLLGLIFGAILWRKYKARAEELERTMNRYKVAMSDLESNLDANKRQLVEKDLELQKLRSNSQRKIKELSRALTAERTGIPTVVAQKKPNSSGNPLSYTHTPTTRPTPITKPVSIATPIPVIKKESPQSVTESPKISKEIQGKGKDDIVISKANSAGAVTAIPAAGIGATGLSSKSTSAKVANNNLQIIEGIGPKMEVLLKDNGIKNWKDLTGMSKVDLRKMLNTSGSKYAIIDPSSWPKQAFMAMNNDWSALIRFQKADGSESKVEKMFNKGQ